MKLCIVAPNFSGGGAERVAVNLANHYSGQGYDVSLLVFNGVGPYLNQVRKSVRLIDLKVSRTRYVLLKLIKALRQEKPTHILSIIRVSNIMVGAALFCSKRARVVFREANTMEGVISLPKLQGFAYKLMMRLFYLRANCIIANSNGTKKDLICNYITGKEKINVIANPVLPADYNILAGGSVDNQWLNDPEIKVVLTVGRLHAQKNHKLLIEAFSIVAKEIKNARLIIIGEGNERKKIKEHRDAFMLNELVDIISFQKNPYPYYKNADVFVLTSDWEGFGNVIVEALSCGTPVISTDCPGGPSSILADGKFGCLIPCGDTLRLAEKIKKHLLDEVKYNEKELIARANVFSVASVGEEYLQIIKGKYNKREFQQ